MNLLRLSVWMVVTLFGLSACGGGGGGGGNGNPPPPVNRAPTVTDAAVAVDPGASLTGVLPGSDPDGDTITFSVASMPTSGSLVLSGAGNANYEYTPNGGFSGSDTFTFSASDGALTSAEGTISIAVNTKPVAQSASFETNEDTVIDAVIAASDAEGDMLTFALQSPPVKGAVSSFDPSSGAFRYNPDNQQDGADSFTVTATDGFQTSNPATVNIEIFRWAGTQQYGSSGFDVAGRGGIVRDTDGNIIVSGETSATINGDPNNGGNDGVIRKFDRRGNEIWTRQFGDADDNSAQAILAIPGSTDFYVVETSFSLPVTSILRVRRYASDGTELWSAPVDLTGLDVTFAASGNAVDANGDVYIVSQYDDDPEPFTVGRTVAVINKVSGVDGSPLWRRLLESRPPMGVSPFIDGAGTILARGAAVNQDNNLIVVGRFLFESPPRPCNYCGFVVAFDPDGNQTWLRTQVAPANTCDDGPNADLYGVVIGEDNDIYVTGTNSPGSSVFFEDGLIFKLNSDATREVWSYCDDSGDDIRSAFLPPPITSVDGGVIALGRAGSRSGREFISIIKLDDTGQLSRILYFGADDAQGMPADFRAGGVVEDEQGYVYISGNTEGQLSGASALGGEDLFLLRLDPNFTLP